MCSSKFRCALVDVGVVSIARLDVVQTTITNPLARNQSERSRAHRNSTRSYACLLGDSKARGITGILFI